ncbi:hypothetical protein A5707_15835 [Mycobacterium kyorinense]|uniref:DUF222 domain-containing protein n=1 Tax=Mycobacterium kyorinense TaxID=487514 RepID=A0A1A2ZI60_9MYCO|nr:DUF222 domain-containing protein [Mycobacterium kyorinense]OBI49945.1 hypothetical protein A5707_15835 [Mycobacterium kyorinense]
MTSDANTDRVGGEPRELLLRAIACITITRDRGGGGILSGKLPQELAEPFTRALMRIEAELLLHDADLFTATSGETRTQSERRADAFTAMILRLDD